MGLPDQLTVARVAAVPFVVGLYIWHFPGHAYWATAVFIAAMATDQVDGWLARRAGHSTPLGSLLDPVADKILVLAVLIVLVGERVFPGWMVAAMVAREFLVSGLRLAALDRGEAQPGDQELTGDDRRDHPAREDPAVDQHDHGRQYEHLVSDGIEQRAERAGQSLPSREPAVDLVGCHRCDEEAGRPVPMGMKVPLVQADHEWRRHDARDGQLVCQAHLSGRIRCP